jgi:hypothetical protein
LTFLKKYEEFSISLAENEFHAILRQANMKMKYKKNTHFEHYPQQSMNLLNIDKSES